MQQIHSVNLDALLEVFGTFCAAPELFTIIQTSPMTIFLDAIVSDPVAFLSCNAANMSGNVQLAPGETGTFKARKQPTFKVRYRTGSSFLGMGNAKATGEAWELRSHKAGDGAAGEEQLFQAVWSGYGGGLATHCTLGTGVAPT